MKYNADKPVLIVGAGIGGLSAAINLAVSGRKNIVMLEKNAQSGGKMAEISQGGFRWDTGPSVITMLNVFQELFNRAGRNLEDYLILKPIEPLTRYFFPDGQVLDLLRDHAATLQHISKIEPGDVEGYLAFLSYSARIHRITGPVFIYSQPPTPRSFLQVPLKDYLKIDPFRTINQAAKSFVRSPHLRQILGRFATYVGASPYLAPATLNVIAHIELNEGVWYPSGGIYQIATALSRLAQELGVEIHWNTEVLEITTHNNQVTGARTTQGVHYPADTVISNVDILTTFGKLIQPQANVQFARKRFSNPKLSSSGFIMLLGLNRTYERLAHHNIFFSPDYQREFTQIFKQNCPPDDPTIYVSITAKTDPEHAPTGKENWFILVNTPPTNSKFDWHSSAPEYRDRIIEILERFGFSIRQHIEQEIILTPDDIARQSGAYHGALYGFSSNDRLAAFRRPSNRDPQIKGLYYAGGTVHPGGGVPMVILSGKVAAEMILMDEKSTSRTRQTF